MFLVKSRNHYVCNEYGQSNQVRVRMSSGLICLISSLILGSNSAHAVWSQDDGLSQNYSLIKNVSIDDRVFYNIPSQSLSQALVLFGKQAGLQIASDPSALAGYKTQKIIGKLSQNEVLKRLLSNTDLKFRHIDKNAVIVAFPNPVYAQAGDVALDTILVESDKGAEKESAYGPVDGYIAERSATASKTDTPITELPRSISVISADQVEAQGAKSITQALRYSAGVAAEVRGSSTRYDIPYMRGFGAPGESVLFLDGLPLLRAPSYASPQIDITNIERVEFLKGPASALYGTSQAGGMVNVVSKRPTRTPQNEVTLTYGSYDRKEATFDFSGPIGDSDTLSTRLVGHLKDADTQVNHIKEERLFLAPSVNWHPTQDTELNLSMSYTYDPEGGYYGVLPTVGTLWDNPGYPKIATDFFEGDPNHEAFKRKQTILSSDFSHRFSDVWSFRASANIMDLSVDSAAVLTRGLVGTNILRYVYDTQEDLNGGAFDANLLGKFSTGGIDHKLLFGVNYQATEWDYQSQFGGGFPIDYTNPDYTLVAPTPGPLTDQYQEQDQAGIYLQDQAKIGRFSFGAGIRFDKVKTETLNRRTSTNSTVDDEAFSGHLGTVYSFDNGVSVYGSWSTSFLPVTGTDANTGLAFEPLTSRQFEAGFKYQSTAFPGLFTVSAYEIEQDNSITVNPLRQSYQNGTTRSRGLEFEAKFQPAQGWNVLAAFGIIDAELIKGVGYSVGNTPIGTPDKTASLWVDYTFDEGSLSGLMVGAGVRYVGSTTGGYLSDGTRFDVPGFTLVDLTLKYDVSKAIPSWDGASLQLNVNNVLDNTYVTCLGNNFCNYGNARSVSLTLAKTW